MYTFWEYFGEEKNDDAKPGYYLSNVDLKLVALRMLH